MGSGVRPEKVGGSRGRRNRDPFADLALGASEAQESVAPDDPFADLTIDDGPSLELDVGAREPAPGEGVSVGPLRLAGPPSAREQAIAGVEQAGGMLRHPIRTVGQMLRSAGADVLDTFNAPVEGEVVSTARALRGKAGPLPGALPAGAVITRQNTPGAITQERFDEAGRNSVINTALSGIPMAALPVRAAINSAAGAYYDPEQPIRGATTGLLLGETVHHAPKVPAAAGRVAQRIADVSDGVVEAGARDMAAASRGTSPYEPPGVTSRSTPEPMSAAAVALERAKRMEAGAHDVFADLALPVEITPAPAPKTRGRQPAPSLIERPTVIGGRGELRGADARLATIREALQAPEAPLAPSGLVDASGAPLTLEPPKRRRGGQRVPLHADSGPSSPRASFLSPDLEEVVRNAEATIGAAVTGPPDAPDARSGPLSALPSILPSAPAPARTILRSLDDAPTKARRKAQPDAVNPKYRLDTAEALVARLAELENRIERASAGEYGPMAWTRFDDDIMEQRSGATSAVHRIDQDVALRDEVLAEIQARGFSDDEVAQLRGEIDNAEVGPGVQDDIPSPTDADAPLDVFSARLRDARTQSPGDFLNYARHTTDRTVEARIREVVEEGAALGRLDKGYESFASQEATAREFANKLVANPLDLDPAKLKNLSGAEVKGLWHVVNENTRVVEEAARLLDEGTVGGAEAAAVLKLIDDTEAATNTALGAIVRETAQTARDLGFLRQSAKLSLDPATWLVRAKRVLGDAPMPDAVMTEIRRLAREAAKVCKLGGA